MHAIAEIRKAISGFDLRIAERDKQRQFDSWELYDRDFSAYLVDFAGVVSGNVLMRQLEALRSPVIVDLMSSTEAIASLFLYDLTQSDKFGVAVGRKDLRDKCQLRRDEQLGIQYIEGDLGKFKTWIDLEKVLSGRKANLIVEDGVKAWDYVPPDRALYGLMLRRVWGFLSPDNGTLIAEIPNYRELTEAGVNLRKWRDILFSTGVDFEYETQPLLGRAFLKLRRTPNSPQQLPLLP